MDREKIERIASDFAALKTAIKDDAMGILYVLNGSAHSDLTPGLREDLAELTWDLQRLSKLAGLEPDTPIGSAPAEKPNPEVPKPTVEKTTGKRVVRRRASKTFNYLMLEGINQKGSWRSLIGQEELIALAIAFDKNAKKNSVVSMYNRWKNTKKWVEWDDPTDLDLTPLGKEQRKKLLDYVNAQDHVELIKAAFKTAWDHDMTPS